LVTNTGGSAAELLVLYRRLLQVQLEQEAIDGPGLERWFGELGQRIAKKEDSVPSRNTENKKRPGPSAKREQEQALH
jgi:hypothetical protein